MRNNLYLPKKLEIEELAVGALDRPGQAPFTGKQNVGTTGFNMARIKK